MVVVQARQWPCLALIRWPSCRGRSISKLVLSRRGTHVISVCSYGVLRVRAVVELGWVHWALIPTNDPASQASLIGQSPVSEVQEAPADGGCALFYSALVSDGHLVSHRGVMAVSLPVVRGVDCPACGNLCGWPAAWPARGVCVACARECGKRCSG